MRTKPFIASSIRRLAVVDSPEDGVPRATWDVADAMVRKTPPSYACTVTVFDQVEARDEHLAAMVALRDNATIHTAESPPKGGPFVTLAVHMDRPAAPGASYDEVVTVNYDGRGQVSGTLVAGIDGWEGFSTYDNHWPFGVVRRVQGGFEVANCLGHLDLWMEPDLADHLRGFMADHDMRFAVGGYVSTIVPTDDRASAVHQFSGLFRTFAMEVDRIRFAVEARQRGRLLAGDPTAMRVLKRLAAGGVLMWSSNSAKRLPSFQLRHGDMVPYKVSGETVDLLFALGLADTLWRPAEGGGGYPSCQWHLLTISRTGLRFLDGDVPTGVGAARQDREMPNPMRRLKPMPFVESVRSYAETLSPEVREAIHGRIEMPRSFDIAKKADAIGAEHALSMVLIGMLSGVADVTEDGRFKLRKP